MKFFWLLIAIFHMPDAIRNTSRIKALSGIDRVFGSETRNSLSCLFS